MTIEAKVGQNFDMNNKSEVGGPRNDGRRSSEAIYRRRVRPEVRAIPKTTRRMGQQHSIQDFKLTGTLSNKGGVTTQAQGCEASGSGVEEAVCQGADGKVGAPTKLTRFEPNAHAHLTARQYRAGHTEACGQVRAFLHGIHNVSTYPYLIFPLPIIYMFV
ncbi:hypothetical protein BC827DRAFT_1156293 [Russula dissimulans]|nr:hypothetical protein BC827DRAFT_1156293 [Russula dissimulans]